jgi:crotonobetainyl-CoA:carnitine CoA-transferase CaiB-like acyl-CoA transferase
MTEQRRPLEGIKVFDLTAWMVGPWASRYLGALGADVLHVERPGTPLAKLGRVPPMIKGTSIGYLAWNFNKRGLALDLKDASHLAFARALIKECDVFLINMRPGVAERLGLGYEELAAENERLVYCSVTGWGTEGPIAAKQGADTHLQAYSGFWSVNGAEGGRPEYYRHYTQLDASTGNYATQAILFALVGRTRTGKGGRIDVTMLEAASAVQTLGLATAMVRDTDLEPLGSAGRWAAPDEAYECQDHRYIGVSATTGQQWHSLCQALGRTDLAGREEFADIRGRVAHRDQLRAEIAPVIASMPRAYWCLQLDRHAVPYGYLLDFDELRRHEQVRDNEYLVEVDAGFWDRVWTGGSPWRFDRYRTAWFAPPLPGEHTEQIRAEFPAAVAAGDRAAVAAGDAAAVAAGDRAAAASAGEDK